MIHSKTIIILEDNLHVLSLLLEKLYELEGEGTNELSVMVLTNSEQVEKYINNNSKAVFDVIILDRDCKLNRSFHILDIERFGAEKVISISTVNEYNEEAKKRGVKRVVEKDLRDIDGFVQKVMKEVEAILTPEKNNWAQSFADNLNKNVREADQTDRKISSENIAKKMLKSLKEATMEDTEVL